MDDNDRIGRSRWYKSIYFNKVALAFLRPDSQISELLVGALELFD